MTEQKEVKSLMEEYKWYDVGETRYAVIEKKNIGEFMGRCERENWEVKDIRMSDEFVENMDEYFGVRMDMEFIRIDKEHSSDYEKQRTEKKNENAAETCKIIFGVYGENVVNQLFEDGLQNLNRFHYIQQFISKGEGKGEAVHEYNKYVAIIKKGHNQEFLVDNRIMGLVGICDVGYVCAHGGCYGDDGGSDNGLRSFGGVVIVGSIMFSQILINLD
ncbi:Hypothetical predicted protein [Octopus vulgaris]|uniref:Uncharacterized protein n=1 Tax=Octopus vulgaris TaxID=6645 RepID=A0AA36AFW8_OCTVU|nr:Hypothetical predicted protein [Octopus vulgaris]